MITFFPTYAQWIETTGVWRARIHGMVTRPLPAASRRRTVAYAVVKRLLKMNEEQFLSPVFQARSEAFLLQRIAGQSVQIKVGSKVIDVGVSNMCDSKIDDKPHGVSKANHLVPLTVNLIDCPDHI